MPAVAVFTFLIALGISLFVTPLVRDVATRCSALDHALASRKVHARPVPRLGGLGFVAGVYGALGLALLVPSLRASIMADGTRVIGLAVAGVTVVTLGVWDDLRGANAKQKLAVQLGAALLLYFTGHCIRSIDNPFGANIELGPLALPVTLLWIAGVSNAMNLIDGLDGLAGGIGLSGAVVAGALALHAGSLAGLLIAAALAGGLIGFLVYNVHPASIFMGDTGSLFLGVVLAALALWPRESGAQDVPLLSMLLALALPIADTLFAIVRRASRGAPVFSADREHLHHRLLDRGLSHRRSVAVLWLTSALLACAGIYTASDGRARGAVLAVTVLGTAVALNRFGLLRMPSSELLERRRANRRRLQVIRAASKRIRAASSVAGIRGELLPVASAVGARSVQLNLEEDPRPLAFSSDSRSFPIATPAARQGTLEVQWWDRVRGDSDAEAALELLCQHLAGALQRVVRRVPGELQILSNGGALRSQGLEQAVASGRGWAAMSRVAGGSGSVVVPRGIRALAALRDAGDRQVGSHRGVVPSTSVLGIPVSRLPLSALLELAFERIRTGRKTLFTTANAHSTIVARRLPRFRSHFQEADAVLPDGISTVWGVRACGGSVRERVCGPDFFEAFMERAAATRTSVFLMGTDEETLQRLAVQFKARWPALIIKGTLAPPHGELSAEVDRSMVEAVNRARPDALFVAMTAPKQELWISQHLGQLDVAFAMGVGAAFDYFAGNKRRAPPLLCRLGLEWLFRLALEPRRLWRRNVDSAVFIWLLAGAAIRRLAAAVLAPDEVIDADARASFRLPVHYGVTLGNLPAQTVNASPGGLCLELDRAIPAGATVEGSIRLEGRDLSFVGRVAWATFERGNHTRGRIGVSFTEVPRELLARLARLGGDPALPARA